MAWCRRMTRGTRTPARKSVQSSLRVQQQQKTSGQVVFGLEIDKSRVGRGKVALVACICGVLFVAMSVGQGGELAAQAAKEVGPVTNLPMPRYVSLKASEGNVRRGPSLTHRIDWVFTRRHMPLQVTEEHGHWRRVMDRDGAGGWVHYALLSGVRTVIVEKDMLALHSRPETQTPFVAVLELGVVARLGDCSVDWCQLSAGGYRGWARKENIWGVGPDKLR